MAECRRFVPLFSFQMQCQDDYIALCRFIRHQLAHQQADGRLPDVRQQKMPTLPYIFQTPKGLLIDLRLFSRCVSFFHSTAWNE